MSEAVEYRIQKARAEITLVIVGVFMLSSLTSLAAPASPTIRIVASILFLLLSVCGLGLAFATKQDGLCRRLYSNVTEFEDPPLDEWKESLEERDAFEVKL